MREIEEMRKRIEAAEGTAGLLAASGDAFTLIEQACRACERGSRELLVRVRCHGGGARQRPRSRRRRR